MNTGALPQERIYPKHGFRTAGAVTCVIAAFILGWSIHAHVAVHNTDTVASIYEPFFSPNGGARNAILAQIDQAQIEILIALYYFTDPILAEALITAKSRGVAVQLILDRSQKNGRHSQAKRLNDAGIKVHFDSKHRIFHHKFMVVDDRVVITGSQNWTKSAESVNAENTLILQGDTTLIKHYRDEFYRLLSL